MLDEVTLYLKHTEVQLFGEGSPKDMLKRYVIDDSLDGFLSKQKTKFKTFNDNSLDVFFEEPETIFEFFVNPETISMFLMKPETTKDLYLDKFFLEIEDNIP